MTDESNGNVSYSVKELIAKLDGKLDGIFLSLSAKADRQDVDALKDRVLDLERGAEKSDAVGVDRRWLFTQTLAVLAIVLAALAAYRGFHR